MSGVKEAFYLYFLIPVYSATLAQTFYTRLHSHYHQLLFDFDIFRILLRWIGFTILSITTCRRMQLKVGAKITCMKTNIRDSVIFIQSRYRNSMGLDPKDDIFYKLSEVSTFTSSFQNQLHRSWQAQHLNNLTYSYWFKFNSSFPFGQRLSNCYLLSKILLALRCYQNDICQKGIFATPNKFAFKTRAQQLYNNFQWSPLNVVSSSSITKLNCLKRSSLGQSTPRLTAATQVVRAYHLHSLTDNSEGWIRKLNQWNLSHSSFPFDIDSLLIQLSYLLNGGDRFHQIYNENE